MQRFPFEEYRFHASRTECLALLSLSLSLPLSLPATLRFLHNPACTSALIQSALLRRENDLECERPLEERPSMDLNLGQTQDEQKYDRKLGLCHKLRGWLHSF